MLYVWSWRARNVAGRDITVGRFRFRFWHPETTIAVFEFLACLDQVDRAPTFERLRPLKQPQNVCGSDQATHIFHLAGPPARVLLGCVRESTIFFFFLSTRR